MDRLQYLLLMGGCVLITLPLEFVFDARVYRRPRRLLKALLPMIVVFYAWDAVAVARGHWWFDRDYVSGIELPFGVPLEELVFFVVIPICALLTLEAVRNLLEGRIRFGRPRSVRSP
jgi:lycopene beta-cyclase